MAQNNPVMKFKINNNDEPNEIIKEPPKVRAKNTEKLELFKNIDINKYDPYLIKILLDGDYKNELGKYKSRVYSLIHEIIENKIKHTKFGINTLLYKMVKDMKKDGSIEKYFNRNKKEIKNENVEMNEDEFIDAVLKIGERDKNMAMNIINMNLSPNDDLYELLISELNNI